MARSVLVDAGFLVALLHRRDANHAWATALIDRFPPPWSTCEAVLSEAFHLLERRGTNPLSELLRRNAVLPRFDLGDELDRTLHLLEKYSNIPMGLADACLVRMTETRSDPVLLTTDTDFRIYRRHGRQIVPCELPG
ncbi:MAG TPA: PIN domain-containing protein [Planctomycetota bacterium]|nr:PIN domain-containing protein [Planctomycetota bacterium]